jgi:hypothetical protein
MAAFGAAIGFVTTALTTMKRAIDAATVANMQSVTARTKVTTLAEAVPFVGGVLSSTYDFGFDLQERFGEAGGVGYGRRGQMTAEGRAMVQRGRDRYGSLGASLGYFAAANDAYMADMDRLRTHPFDMARDRAEAAGGRRLREFDAATASTEYGVAARADAAGPLAGLLFRGRYGGRQQFDSQEEYDAQIRGAERARVMAAAARAQAGRERVDAQTETILARRGVDRGAYDAATSEAERLRAAAGSNPSVNRELLTAVANAEQQGARYQEQLARYQEALNREKQKTVELSEREYDLARRSLDVQQARLSVAESKLKQYDGFAEGYFGMDGGQRQGLLDAVREANSRELRDLSPEQRQILAGSGITADFFRKKAREDVFFNNDTRDQFNELLRLTGQKTRDELLDERKGLQAEVEVKFKANEEQLARSLREAFKNLDPELRKLVEEVTRVEIQKAKLGAIAAGTQRGG